MATGAIEGTQKIWRAGFTLLYLGQTSCNCKRCKATTVNNSFLNRNPHVTDRYTRILLLMLKNIYQPLPKGIPSEKLSVRYLFLLSTLLSL